MKFTKDDLKPGMAVKLRDGTRCIAFPNSCGIELAIVSEDGDLCGIENVRALDNNLKRISRNYPGLDVMKVYGLSINDGILFSRNGCDGRPLLWERHEPKKMTISQIEEALGYPIEIIKEEK